MGDEQPDDAMAAMMGFSAFGSNKRHKPNPENANRPPSKSKFDQPYYKRARDCSLKSQMA